MSVRRNKEYFYILNELRRASKKYDAPIWRYVRELMDRPKRRRVSVNLSKINRYSSEGDVVVVPGKVLGAGNIDHRITIAAYDFSLTAYTKLREAGCMILTIPELIQRFPKGSGVKIIV